MTPDRARQAAAALIRCMDRRDEAGAALLVERIGSGWSGGRDLDVVLGWVWQLERQRVLDRAAAQRARRAAAIDELLAEVYAREDASNALNARRPRWATAAVLVFPSLGEAVGVAA